MTLCCDGYCVFLSCRRSEPVGFCEGCVFKGLKRDLLGQHDVSGNQATIWNDAPTYKRSSVRAELKDIRANSEFDPIGLAALAADDIEVTLGVELGELCGCEPGPQQSEPTQLRRVFIPGAPEQPTNGPRAPLTFRDLSTWPEQVLTHQLGVERTAFRWPSDRRISPSAIHRLMFVRRL